MNMSRNEWLGSNIYIYIYKGLHSTFYLLVSLWDHMKKRNGNLKAKRLSSRKGREAEVEESR